MNKILSKFKYLLLAAVFITGSMAAQAIGEKPSDFTGDSFYGRPIVNNDGTFIPIEDLETIEKNKLNNPSKTIPPLKLIRLKIKAYQYGKASEKEVNQSPLLEDVENSMVNEPCFSSEDNLKAKSKRDKKAQEDEITQITINCKHMDYQAETGHMNATGEVLVVFPHQRTTLTADFLDYDKMANKMHAEGNVVIEHSGQKTYGESIDIDLNEESIFIEKPHTQNADIRIVAEEGFVQRNIVTQTNGTIDIDKGSRMMIRTSGGPDVRQYMRTMVVPEIEKKYITGGKSKVFKIQANEIIISSKENLDVIQLKKARITSADKTVLKIPRMKIYSNKGHEYFEGNYPEIGARKFLGMYIGPGFIVELPKGSLLKLIPALTYKSKIGVGGVARFWSGTNETQVSYGTSKSKVVVRGEQRLDDDLKLIYGSYDYIDNWFLGRRAPKYGVDLVYDKLYSSDKFFGSKLTTTYQHKASVGYFQDMESHSDSYYSEIGGNGIGTTRFRYMAQIRQPFYSYSNEDKLLFSDIGVLLDGSAAVYGTGDTQTIGRIGPYWHLQYKRWMQDLGYSQAAYDDHTPIPVYDAFRYGHSQVYLREYLRVCPYLTVAWQGAVTLTDDTYNNKMFQECSFYASLGPQDLKLNFGYDIVRKNAFINMVFAIDPKGTTVDYEKLVIKNPDNFNKMREKNQAIYKAAHEINDNKKQGKEYVLTKAIVEDIEEQIDDI